MGPVRRQRRPSALTVLASGSAIVSYSSLTRSLGTVSEKSVPGNLLT